MKKRYQVSEAFKESCKSNIGLNRYGRIHVVEDNIDIIGEGYGGQLVDFKIEDNCYEKETFIGSMIAKKITVNILNPDNSINLENKTIQVFVGIEIDGELEEIPYGSYIIEIPENKEVQQKTSFTGYDYMIKFNPIYQDRVTYPIKLCDLLKDVCNQVGLELGSTEFVNSNYMVLGNPFLNDEDCRTVLFYIAQLAGGFVKIGRDDKVYIRNLNNSLTDLLRVKDVHNMPVKNLFYIPVSRLASLEETLDANEHENLDGNNYFEDFAKNEQWGGVNSLVLSVQSDDIQGENTSRTDEASIEEFGLTEIKIEDNPFLINEEEREKVIVDLWEHLRNIKYLPFKTSYYGFPYLDSGDLICLYDTKDVYYASYAFNHTFIYNGAFSGSIDTPAMTKMQTLYKNTQNIKSKFRRVELSIDKINGKITSVIERQDEQENTFTAKIEETEKSILSTVEANITSLDENIQASLELKVDTENLISEINASADTISLNAGRLVIDTPNFKLDGEGNMMANDAILAGIFRNYLPNYLGNELIGLEIDGCTIKFYDWTRDQDWLGSVGSVGTDEQGGLDIYCQKGKALWFGHKNNKEDIYIDSCFYYDSREEENPPYIANTWDGTMPVGNNITLLVTNGLITGWEWTDTSISAISNVQTQKNNTNLKDGNYSNLIPIGRKVPIKKISIR